MEEGHILKLILKIKILLSTMKSIFILGLLHPYQYLVEIIKKENGTIKILV